MKWLILLLLLSPVIISAISFSGIPTGIGVYHPNISTNALLGFAYIKSLLAYNSSFTQQPYGVSLQLNAVLQVQTPTQTYYFWVQNFACFITNSSQYAFGINMFNITTYNATLTAYGHGYVYNNTIYVYTTPLSFYSLPLSFYLWMNESYTSNGVYVSVGYISLLNGVKQIPPHLIIYDTVFIPVSNVINASFVVNSYRPLGYLYDDFELIWGGFANGEQTYFQEMQSALALYYLQNGQWVSVPDVSTYGYDTAEGADNLHVIYYNGLIIVTTGTFNNATFPVNFIPPSLTYVEISSPVPFYINGTLITNKSIAMYINEPITVQFTTNYTANSSAFALLTSQSSYVIYPSDYLPTIYKITPSYTWYYKVNVNSLAPVYALVNGKNTTLTSGYYPQGTEIQIENLTYYYSSNHRFVITSIYPQTTITVNSPLTVNVSGINQYFINVNSPIPVYAIINGMNKSLTSGWYNAGTSVRVENITYYKTSNERFVITGISLQTFTVNNPITVTITAVPQYFINVSSSVPLYALINGKNESLTSGWYNANTSIKVENITYYQSPNTRFVITSITPQTFNVNSPTTVKIVTVKQYLVTISSSYPVTINGITTSSEWVDAGTTITLNVNLPFYETGSFVGTENIPLGGSITVNQPINESLETSISLTFVGIIVIVVALIGVAVVFVRRK